MRSLVITLVACASVAGAQVPGTTPAAPSAPAVKGSSGAEFRVGGFMINSERSMEFNSAVTTKTAQMKGIDVLMRAKFIGLQIKSLTSEFEGQPNITSADARLLLFPRAFSIMVGAGRRALWSTLNATSPTQFDMGLAGVSMTHTIGGTGLRTNLTAAMYLPVKKSSGSSTASSGAAEVDKGMEGEASIMYTPPKVPFFLQVGYRTEVFTAKSGTRTTPEEVRGLKVGGGLQIGGR
jgi:hypothetical protein